MHPIFQRAGFINRARILGFATLSILAASPAAAEKCFTTEFVPASFDCTMSGEAGSADFGGGCVAVAEHEKKVETACQPKWINVPQTYLSSHSAFCKMKGLATASIDGKICAAGERRPSTGEGHDSINYHSGKWGGSTSGGSYSTVYRRTHTSGNSDSGQTTQTTQVLECWNDGDKKDHDGTDRLVAFVCKDTGRD